MKKQAFTLIELLVVITIIGILAVGAVSVFTTQLQGARDSTRISDLKLMETAAHQIFSDDGQYPVEAGFSGAILPFVSKPLKDPKKDKPVCRGEDGDTNQNCKGYYAVFNDSYDLERGAFKLGVHFEKETNYANKSTNDGKDGDGGNENGVYEVYAGAGANSGATVTTDGVVVY